MQFTNLPGFALGLLACGGAPLYAGGPRLEAKAAETVGTTVPYVPVTFRTISGVRPFVQVKLNGRPFLFMVHSNASFYLMTTHANAASVGVTNLQKKSDFGIEAPGRVSSLGEARTTLGRLEVGPSMNFDVPMAVFEVPADDMQGMLGVRWLRADRVIVDYDRYRVGLPGSQAATSSEDKRLIAAGYVGHRMTFDEAAKTYSVRAVVNGVATKMLVSTVGANMLDTVFALRAGVAVGPIVDQFAGPSGATGDLSLSRRPIMISLDGQNTASTQPSIEDYYAYNGAIRPPEGPATVNGVLGADFMLANGAVIDFGSETLFIPEAR